MSSTAVDNTSDDVVMADAPFNSSTADIVFRTPDKVDFRLHKLVLSLSSPFFNDMFSLTQPPALSSTDQETIPVTEDSKTFDLLLRFCYPVSDPQFSQLAVVVSVLEAAIKYQIQFVVDHLRAAMTRFVESDALDVYAASCHLQLEQEARMAAVHLKNTAIWDDGAEDFSKTAAGFCMTERMKTISAGAYIRLLNYLRAPRNPGVALTVDKLPTPSSSRLAPSLSFGDEDALASCDIVLESNDRSEIRAHRWLIRLASGEELLKTERLVGKKLEEAGNLSVGTASFPAYFVDLDGRTLQTLVLLCYPHPDMPSIDFHVLQDVLAAAIRFNVKKIVDVLRQYMTGLINTRSIAVYRISVRHGWHDEAQQALQHVLRYGVAKTSYSVDLDGASAYEYCQLLQMQHQYVATVMDAVKVHNTTSRGDWKRVNNNATLLQTAPYIPIIENQYYGRCTTCLSSFNSSRAFPSECLCIYSALQLALKRTQAFQDDLKKAATDVSTIISV